jgi:hypothetical protein
MQCRFVLGCCGSKDSPSLRSWSSLKSPSTMQVITNRCSRKSDTRLLSMRLIRSLSLQVLSLLEAVLITTSFRDFPLPKISSSRLFKTVALLDSRRRAALYDVGRVLLACFGRTLLPTSVDNAYLDIVCRPHVDVCCTTPRPDLQQRLRRCAYRFFPVISNGFVDAAR